MPRSNASAYDNRRARGTESFRCRVCRGIHSLRRCTRFLRLSVEKRMRAVLINKYCSNCLAHQHSGASCRSGATCHVCHGDHHTLLHLREHVRKAPSPRSENRAQAPSLTTILRHRNPEVLPTAVVKLDNGVTTFDTKVLVDPCTPVSRISESLAKKFRLPITRVGGEGVCTAILLSRIDQSVKLEVCFKVDRLLSVRTPFQSLDPSIRNKFRDIVLADNTFYESSNVDIVLGAETYPQIIRPGLLAGVKGLPVAQATAFGWMLSGTWSH